MNRILNLYLLRQLAATFAFATGAVTFVVLFTQSFRLLSLVIENSGTMLLFFHLMGLSALTFLPLIMPLGLGTAIVFTYHRLAVDSELVVMRAAGLSPMRLIQPALILAAGVMMICYALTLWITPAANSSLVGLQYKMRDSYAVFLAHPGSFNDLADGLTFYANKRGPNGSLQGILIHDVRNPENPITTMAATGQVVTTNDQPHMIIFNGRRQEFDRTTGKVSELAFDQYVLDLDALRNAPATRFPDPREQTIGELLNPSPEMLRARGPMSHFTGELHARLATPLLCLSYTLIGLAAILAGGFNRRGMGGRILLSALIIIVGQALFMTISSAVSRDAHWAALLYLVAILPAPVGFILVNAEFLHGWRAPSLIRRAA